MSRSSRRNSILVVVVLLICGCLGSVVAQRAGLEPPQQSNINQLRQTMNDFAAVYDLVQRNYAEPVDPNKAIYDGAIPNMLHVLDPHSNFFDPKEFALLNEEQSGKYYGVGMQIGPRNNRIIVMAPFAGAPAYRAGIRPGDIIVSVNGKSTEGMTTADVADNLKGDKGTPVKVVILREGLDKPIEFTLIRDEIPRYSVDVHFLLRPGVGYLHINGFQQTTTEEVNEALSQMGELKALVLDLRSNGGGLLNEGVGVADKFLNKGDVIVSHHGRVSPEKIYYAENGNGGKLYPIVVLVNRGTASAAEIVSGALQDHDRALIVGETTFGKGLVQNVLPLPDKAGLALTTAHYYTPSGRLIQRPYDGVSLYDYFNAREDGDGADDAAPAKPKTDDVKMTDSGRTVYGGGGITPDVHVAPVKATHTQEVLYIHYSFFNFAKRYVMTHKITHDFNADENVLREFKSFIAGDKVVVSDKDFKDNEAWIKTQIKSELFVSAFGQQEGQTVRIQDDQLVLKALELMPKAKELLDNVRKVTAQRASARR